MVGPANSINESTTGITGFTGTAFVGTPVTEFAVLVGGGTTSTISNVAATANTGAVLQNNSGANPTYSTATYPSTTTINQILYSSAANTVAGITAANNGTMISGATGVPSWLANGATGEILTATTGSPPSWQAAPAGGIPTIGTSTDRAVVTWNGTNGDAVRDNPNTIVDSSGRLLLPVGVAATNVSLSVGGTANTGINSTSSLNLAMVVSGTTKLTASNNGIAVTNGFLSFSQTFVLKRITTAISYSVSASTDYLIAVTDNSAARTITLPATPNTGTQYVIKDEAGTAQSANNITVTVSGGVRTIDGQTTQLINVNYGSMSVYYDGTNYFTM